MSYHALYRKYRPLTLEDVVGQEYIVKIIQNSLKNNKVNHAYMFSGPRGTGKTTMAKILARNINCLELKEGVACGKCKNCLAIGSNATSDIIEIDAASNNGVDEIREIKNKINLVPSELKYKVYIIDEVHMLTIGAFNALLKTLEEPPGHVIFILATTDLHKVPVTIISRCQCFDFKRLTEQKIVERLSYIASNEKVKVEPDVLQSIANLSDGGMRDAIGMLDKMISYCSGKVTSKDFEEINGIVSLKEKLDFIKYIETSDIISILKFIDKIYDSGKDMAIFCQDLMILCRNLVVDYYLKKETVYDIEFLLKLLELFNSLVGEIKLSNNIKITFEVKILSFLDNSKKITETLVSDEKENISIDNHEDDSKQIILSNDKLEIKYKNIDDEPKQVIEDNLIDDDYNKINYLIVNNCLAKASKESLLNIKKQWNKLNDYVLDNQYGAIACYIVDGTVRAASEKEVIITFDYDSMVNRGFKLISRLESLFDKIFGEKYRISLITTEEWNNQRKQYIENKNQGIVYEYKEIPSYNQDLVEEVTSNDNSITKEAIDLFGENVVTSI